MFKFCEENIPGIHYIFVSQLKVQQTEEFLANRFDSCIRILNMQSYHSYISLSVHTLRICEISLSKHYIETRNKKQNKQGYSLYL